MVTAALTHYGSVVMRIIIPHLLPDNGHLVVGYSPVTFIRQALVNFCWFKLSTDHQHEFPME